MRRLIPIEKKVRKIKFHANAILREVLRNISKSNRHLVDPSKLRRRRKQSFATMGARLIKIANRSLEIENNVEGTLKSLVDKPPKGKKKEKSLTKTAFSTFRQKYKFTAFVELNNSLVEKFYDSRPLGNWRRHRFIGIDGSQIRVPKTAETIAYFGAPKKGQIAIMSQVSLAVDLITGTVINGQIAPRTDSERTLAKRHLAEIAEMKLADEKLVYVFDRGYFSAEMLQHMLDQDEKFIFRIQPGIIPYVDMQTIIKGGVDKDIDVEIAGIQFKKIRLVIKKLDSGEDCVLFTNLSRRSFKKGDMFRAYWLQWGCEEAYKNLKVILSVENFTSKKVNSIKQEFFATILAHNVISMECWVRERAWNPDKPPEERINRRVVFGSTRELVFLALLDKFPQSELDEEFDRLAESHRLPVKLGRSFPRTEVAWNKSGKSFGRTC